MRIFNAVGRCGGEMRAGQRRAPAGGRCPVLWRVPTGRLLIADSKSAVLQELGWGCATATRLFRAVPAAPAPPHALPAPPASAGA